jgi:hypothetical protein
LSANVATLKYAGCTPAHAGMLCESCPAAAGVAFIAVYAGTPSQVAIAAVFLVVYQCVGQLFIMNLFISVVLGKQALGSATDGGSSAAPCAAKLAAARWYH